MDGKLIVDRLEFFSTHTSHFLLPPLVSPFFLFYPIPFLITCIPVPPSLPSAPLGSPPLPSSPLPRFSSFLSIYPQILRLVKLPVVSIAHPREFELTTFPLKFLFPRPLCRFILFAQISFSPYNQYFLHNLLFQTTYPPGPHLHRSVGSACPIHHCYYLI